MENNVLDDDESDGEELDFQIEFPLRHIGNQPRTEKIGSQTSDDKGKPEPKKDITPSKENLYPTAETPVKKEEKKKV